MTKEQEIKHTVLVSLSAYATHKEYTVDEWFKANKAKREDEDVKKAYNHVMGKS